MELTTMEYKKIARFYELPKPNNKSYKDIAEDMLAGKLCKCIKKVKKVKKVIVESTNNKPDPSISRSDISETSDKEVPTTPSMIESTPAVTE